MWFGAHLQLCIYHDVDHPVDGPQLQPQICYSSMQQEVVVVVTLDKILWSIYDCME